MSTHNQSSSASGQDDGTSRLTFEINMEHGTVVVSLTIDPVARVNRWEARSYALPMAIYGSDAFWPHEENYTVTRDEDGFYTTIAFSHDGDQMIPVIEVESEEDRERRKAKRCGQEVAR